MNSNTSLLQCFDSTGAFQVDTYIKQRRAAVVDETLELCLKAAAEEEIEFSKRRRRQAQARGHMPKKRDSTGTLVPIAPQDTIWWQVYIAHPPLNKKRYHEKFRRRFRMPYQQYLELLEDVKANSLFVKWTKADATGRSASPIELLLLGSLRYLGRGFTFDDCEEFTAISEETHRRFFHIFIKYGSTVLFNRYVVAPSTSQSATTHMAEFIEAGMPGCVGSTDATHIAMIRCPSQLRNYHLGHKLDLPTRTYNLTTNHRKRILSTTTGHPGRWNDKTLILFDAFAVGVKKGDILSDVEFVLLEKNRNTGEVFERKYRGAWIIVDNGYLNWSCTVPPFKACTTYAELRWAKWIESMRKDVECVFGILKGRFRILKTGIRVHGINACDKIWLTCCALHNYLLEADGLSSEWERGVASDYELNLGLLRGEDLEHLPPHLRHRTFDIAHMGRGDDCLECTGDLGVPETIRTSPPTSGSTATRIVKDIPLEFFRDRLVEHFDILFREHHIKWPSRTGLTCLQWLNEPLHWEDREDVQRST